MTYRDDHEAAIARSEALEQKLDDAEESLETERERSARLERELSVERAKRSRLEAKLGTRAPEPSRQELHGLQERPHIPLWREDNEQRRSDFVGVGIALAIVFGMVLFVVALVMGR